MLSDSLRRKNPLVHCISNIVSANDCANLLLAIGASPIMAQAPEEMAEITAKADALVLNTGTPNYEKFEACRIAGITANSGNIPVILDPVGVGASAWRLDQVTNLLRAVHPSIIRANGAEARALLGIPAAEHGVDDTGNTSDAALAQKLAEQYDCTILLSGESDIVSDTKRTLTLAGGSPRMKQITGAGCMLSALCGAFAGVADPFSAAQTAAVLWKRGAECAEKQAGTLGLGSFHAALFDALSRLHV